jgi:Cu/Ag efflux protein CusF
MTNLYRAARSGAAGLMIAAFGACSSLGGLGNVLGSVLGTGGNQVQGTVLGVDTRTQYISLQQSNGQAVSLGFDNQTRVVYQNQNYSVTSLQRGDQVTANVQQTNNGAYYTDYVQVDRSVSGTGSATGSVQQFEGTVRAIDYNNGWFTMDANNARYTVNMPSNPRTSDTNTFRSLRTGQYARLYGVYLSNSRIELTQFY